MDIISQFFPLILAAGVKPWALGVLVVILGLLGLVLLACCYDDKAEDGAFWNSELFEGCVLICGLMVVVPFLLLLPEEVRRSLDFEYMLEALALVVVAAIWLGMHFGLPWLRRALRERPRPQRQGRSSPRGLGRRSKKGRR